MPTAVLLTRLCIAAVNSVLPTSPQKWRDCAVTFDCLYIFQQKLRGPTSHGFFYQRRAWMNRKWGRVRFWNRAQNNHSLCSVYKRSDVSLTVTMRPLSWKYLTRGMVFCLKLVRRRSMALGLSSGRPCCSARLCSLSFKRWLVQARNTTRSGVQICQETEGDLWGVTVGPILSLIPAWCSWGSSQGCKTGNRGLRSKCQTAIYTRVKIPFSVRSRADRFMFFY